jgi:hypothetical protein
VNATEWRDPKEKMKGSDEVKEETTWYQENAGKSRQQWKWGYETAKEYGTSNGRIKSKNLPFHSVIY